MGQPTQVVKRTSGTVIGYPLGPVTDDEHREEGCRQDDDGDLVDSHVVPRFRGGPFLPMILVYHRWVDVFTVFSSENEFLDEHDDAREEQSRGHKAAEQ